MSGLDRVLIAFLILSTFAAVQERINEAIRQSALGFAERWWPGDSEGWTTYITRRLTGGGWNILLGITVACLLNANLLSLFANPTPADIAGAKAGEVDAASVKFFCEYAWGPCAPDPATPASYRALGVGVGAVAAFGIGIALHFVGYKPRRKKAVKAHQVALSSEGDAATTAMVVAEESAVSAVYAWKSSDSATALGLVLLLVAVLLGLHDTGLTLDWFLGCAAMGAAAALGSKFWHDLAFGLTEARERARSIPADVQVAIASFRKDE